MSHGRRSIKFGDSGSGFRPVGAIQDFYKLREKCKATGTLFEDPDFPADDSSIFYSKKPPKPFEWKRPHELCSEPRLFVEGATRFDIVQGELGDCWMLAATANLTLNPTLFHQVVPDDQNFLDDYAGIFHFRFWQYGKWIDIVVDDRLPTFYGQLVFLQSRDQNEFWSALLEKAYAKLHGSYESLKGGTTCEAMEDFTGGVTELFELDKAPSNLFKIMLKAYDRSSLIGCSIKPDPTRPEAKLPNGLVRGHAYSVTAVKLVDIKTPRMSGKIPLLRIRNPWGSSEWNGPWSDQSREWQYIPSDQKEEIGLVFDTDGEFWMSFSDFMKNFNNLEICNLSPDSLMEEQTLNEIPEKTWQTHLFEGAWVRSATAGGCRNFLDSFWLNPQYCVTLEDVDEDDEDDMCTLIVALMQKNRRRQRRMGLDCLTIGFAIYHLKNPDSLPRPLGKDFFKYNSSVARSPTFINLREVSCRFKLPPGTYSIVPSTFDPNEEGEFVLRVFSEKKNDMQEFDEEIGIGEVDDRIKPQEDEKEEDVNKDEILKQCFHRIAGDDLEIDAYELKQILDYVLKKEFQFDGFGINLCRGMVAMMDVDRSGKLGLEEFKDLWHTVSTWKAAFKLYDKDNTGSLGTFELRSALTSAGYKLNWHVLKVLVLRYANKNGSISFEDFIVCAVKLKHMIAVFKERDPRNVNVAEFKLDEWVEATMYA